MHLHGQVLFDVPAAACVYPHGASYDPQRWHPFTATLRQYRDLGGDVTYETSILRSYYERFQPATLLELFFPPEVVATNEDASLAHLQPCEVEPVLPWDAALVAPMGEAGLDPSHGHQGFGPVSAAKGRLEFGRLTHLWDELHREPFDVDENGGVQGYFLLRGADYRFVVRVGFHRVAVLSALGVPKVRVHFVDGQARAWHAETLARWPLVRTGVYPEPLARRFVDQFFDDDWTSRVIAPQVEPTWRPPA
ncbi:MAG: hypothetical protein P1P87_05030 [Trueperaceae bacterium]|nr:hypothetical protein [Trueperaceae bacterium]